MEYDPVLSKSVILGLTVIIVILSLLGLTSNKPDIHTELSNCEKLQDVGSQKWCYSNVAERIVTTDPRQALQVCESKMTKNSSRNWCYSNIASKVSETNLDGAFEICRGKITASNDRDMCFTFIAHRIIIVRRSLDESIQACAYIEDEDKKNSCEYYSYSYYAKKLAQTNISGALEVCGSIKSTINEEICIDLVINAIAEKDPDTALDICNQTNPNPVDNIWCHVNVAEVVARKDLDEALKLCDEIENIKYKAECYGWARKSSSAS